jgi:hypothetical protein
VSTLLRFTGVRRDGSAITGAFVPVDLESWVRHKFDVLGWRKLSVTRDGEEVAAICPGLDDGKRTWWSETSGGDQ